MIAAVRPAATVGEQRIELADILNRYGDAYLREHRLRSAQAKVVHAIRSCRTAALGGHYEWCARCGFRRYAYHSCRNRHCPKCQALGKAQWLELRRRELLPTPYFHNVFTLPHELNPLILFSEQNQRLLLGLLFHAAAQTLLTFGRNNLGPAVAWPLPRPCPDRRRSFVRQRRSLDLGRPPISLSRTRPERGVSREVLGRLR
jgi:hypothetical protein